MHKISAYECLFVDRWGEEENCYSGAGVDIIKPLPVDNSVFSMDIVDMVDMVDMVDVVVVFTVRGRARCVLGRWTMDMYIASLFRVPT